MAIQLRSRHDITIDAFRRVAWNGEELMVDGDTLLAVDEHRAQFLEFLERNPAVPVYGVNIGAGDAAGARLTATQQAEYLSGLTSATSFGEPLPERVTRGIVLARMASFLGGHAAVTSQLVQHVAGMLGGPLPPVPSEGNGGSGEILALGHLFASVPGRLRLGLKEPMALINGSPCASALVADTALRAVGTLELAERVLALAADALQTPHEHFAAALGDLWDDVDEIAALTALRALLRGADPRRRTTQALVSVRVIPKVLAAAYRAWTGASLVAETSLSSVNDNPIFVPPSSGQPAAVLSNGSFHNQHAIVAIDGCTRAAADLCQLAHALVQGIYADRTALPGQDNLGVGTLYMPSSAWAEEARAAAAPAVLPAPAIGQNDVPNPVFTAWNRSVRADRCLHATLAILATLASQSFAVTERHTSPALQPLLTAIREELPPVAGRRNLGPELEALAAAFADRAQQQSAAPHAELAAL